MHRAGCRLALVGYESGTNPILKNVGKSTTEQDIVRFSEDARDAGLMVHGCFILGLPGETTERLQKAVELSVKLDPDTANFIPICHTRRLLEVQWMTGTVN